MNILFCLDRRMLDGLHVTAYSILENRVENADPVHFHVFSDDLAAADLSLLRATLEGTGKPFTLDLRRIDPEPFAQFPALNGSLATYYRLLVPQELEVDRFLYLDVDLLCRMDLQPLYTADLQGCPVGMVPEAPLASCIDETVRGLMKDFSEGEAYYNAGVLLVDAARWREEGLTMKCLEFVSAHRPQFHDQSAMNMLLRGRIRSLPHHYNLRTNAREDWPRLKSPLCGAGCVLHFVDYPKPWDRGARFLHPMGSLWARYLRKTALPGAPRLHEIRKMRPIRWNRKTLRAYRKSLKDALLFKLYNRGILKRVKGMPS